MFTGLVEETGIITNVRILPGGTELDISAEKIFSDLGCGDSVCTNGVCLTATKIKNNIFTVFVSEQTQKTAKIFSKGDIINLERALTLNKRLGGHIVTGHVDGVGVVKRILKNNNSVFVTISASHKIMRYIVEKGSVTLNGISLTVASLSGSIFTVCIIPETFSVTNLKLWRIGSKINIETDILGKYVEKFLPGCNNINRDTFFEGASEH